MPSANNWWWYLFDAMAILLSSVFCFFLLSILIFFIFFPCPLLPMDSWPSTAVRFQHNMPHPMLFEVKNPKTNRISHCGVLEFTAPDRSAYMPLWVREERIKEGKNEWRNGWMERRKKSNDGRKKERMEQQKEERKDRNRCNEKKEKAISLLYGRSIHRLCDSITCQFIDIFCVSHLPGSYFFLILPFIRPCMHECSSPRHSCMHAFIMFFPPLPSFPIHPSIYLLIAADDAEFGTPGRR